MMGWSHKTLGRYPPTGKNHECLKLRLLNQHVQLALRRNLAPLGRRLLIPHPCQIALLLGGRIAEELTTGEVTTGAGNDLERVTDLARRMVCEWGMSDALGPLTFGKKEEQIFLGREISQHQDYSEDTALQIDAEVRRIVSDNYQRSTALLTENKQRLVDIADALLAREVLDGEQVRRLAYGHRLDDVAPTPAVAPAVAGDDSTRDRSREKDRLIVTPMPNPLAQE